MGQGLPKAVTSVVVKRRTASAFRAAIAEMNGWRASMEDANLIFMREDWGFFGVFDGHGGDQCSAFVARRFEEELQKGCPEDDEDLSSLALKVDAEFLDSGQQSGSTGTFVIVKPPQEAGGKYTLRVGNVGDSRVLLGRKDGTMVEGPGTDGAQTTDHKPDHPSERERITRTGGTVQNMMGVARVNGELAVSRAFGDAQHKMTGGPSQADRPVSAVPELTTLQCDASDFLLLVCDGISEGAFPNRDVVRLAAERLEDVDPGAAATAVCREALKQGSKDNLSCMIVLFGGGQEKAEMELIPGPCQNADHSAFLKAYAAMAEHAGKTLEEAVEMRYDLIIEKLGREDAESQDTDGDTSEAMKAELADFGDGPGDDLTIGSVDRTQWFANWVTERSVGRESGGDADGPAGSVLSMLRNNPQLRAMMADDCGLRSEGQGEPRTGREVQAASLEELRAAVEDHPTIQWDERLVKVCKQVGTVLQDDESDGTTQVTFKTSCLTVWLPTNILTEVRNTVLVAPVDELRPAVEAHSALKWDARLEELCQQEGEVLKVDDTDGTSRVRFSPPLGLTAWLPTDCLRPCNDGRAVTPEELQPQMTPER